MLLRQQRNNEPREREREREKEGRRNGTVNDVYSEEEQMAFLSFPRSR
jgi:hypothetical protein